MTANRVRIIGGDFRSRILRFPARPGLRPSPDRVRETLFNWLGQELSGLTCLDLFAGSGALGLEAISRGAQRAVLVERDRATYQALLANVRALGCEARVDMHHADALEFTRHPAERFDVIFLDPPFGTNLVETLLPNLPNLIQPNGVMYVESADGISLLAPWHLHRARKAGNVTYQLFNHGDQ